MASRPALKFCLALASGILLGWVVPLPPPILLLVTAILFLVVLAALVFFRPRGVLTALLFPVLIASFGALLITADMRTVPAGDPARFLSPDTVTVTGTVSEIVGRSARSARFQLDCSSISKGDTSLELSGRILVMLSGRAANGPGAEMLTPGRKVEI
ncbi:MAG TPA: DUF4131 domain-containing protein, partial [Bacteroidota bacterium]|nr:DUF4131 domain-containing protein [Bacteroidota bacterium]